METRLLIQPLDGNLSGMTLLCFIIVSTTNSGFIKYLYVDQWVFVIKTLHRFGNFSFSSHRALHNLGLVDKKGRLNSPYIFRIYKSMTFFSANFFQFNTFKLAFFPSELAFVPSKFHANFRCVSVLNLLATLIIQSKVLDDSVQRKFYYILRVRWPLEVESLKFSNLKQNVLGYSFYFFP